MANQLDGTVTMIDGVSLAIIGTIPIGAQPEAVLYFGGGQECCVSNFMVTLLASSEIVATGRDSQGVLWKGSPHKVPSESLNKAGAGIRGLTGAWPYLFVTDALSGRLTYFDAMPRAFDSDPLSRSAFADLGNSLMGAVRTPFSNVRDELYVADKEANSVVVQELGNNGWQTSTSIVVGKQPTGVSVRASGDKVYVTNYADNTVSVIDVYQHNVIDTIPVGGGPVSMGEFIRARPDYLPAPFAFNPAYGQSSIYMQKIVVSNSVAIAGFDVNVPISVTCSAGASACGYSVNGGPWTSTPGWLAPGQPAVRVKVAAPLVAKTTATATLKVGGRSANFTVSSK